jgi:hypothetical protein
MFHFYQVLTALGIVMLICGSAIPLITALQTRADARWYSNGTAVSIALAIMAFAASNILITTAQGDDPALHYDKWPGAAHPADTFFQVLLRYLVYPGALPGVSSCATWCILLRYVVYEGTGVSRLDQGWVLFPRRGKLRCHCTPGTPSQNTRLRSDGAAPTPGLCRTQALPWCGVCFFGIGTGFEFGTDARRAAKRAGTCPAVAHGAAAWPLIIRRTD